MINNLFSVTKNIDRLKVGLLYFFLLFSFSSFADSSHIATTEGDPSSIVAGSVNVITGDHYVAETDIVVQGAVPLRLPRLYLGSREERVHVGWHFFNHLYARRDSLNTDPEFNGPRGSQITLTEPTGTVLIFEKPHLYTLNKILHSCPILIFYIFYS